MSGFSSCFDGDRILLRRMREMKIQQIHLASLEIAERTGMRFLDQRAVSLLKKAGAAVSDGNLVRIPSHLMEWALRTAPKRIVLCDRSGRKAMALQPFNSYYGVGSDGHYILDHRDGTRRNARLSDIVDGMTVCDALPGIDYAMSMFLPSDVPVPLSDRYQMEAMLVHSSKPIMFVTHDLQGCRDAVEMAEAVAGGPEALRANPQVCCYANFTAPLRHNQEALQKLMFMAEKGLPCNYTCSVTARGLITPVTFAGCLALSNAGQLAGLLLAQLTREGAPVVCCHAGGGAFDMRTMVLAYSAPETRAFRSDLAHHYGLPTFGMAGCSDSKLPDGQALAEASLTLLVDTLAGCNLIHDVGYLESGLTGSLELLVMCDDVIGWIRRLVQPVAVNEETLALDLIHATGPEGEYLGSDHTRQHYREDWYPNLMDRENHPNWLERGGKSYRKKARERVEQILGTRRAPDLGEAVIRDVRAVLERAADVAGVSLPY